MTREEKYLEAGKIIIDFAKTHDNIFIRFGGNCYSLMLNRYHGHYIVQFFLEAQIMLDVINLTLFYRSEDSLFHFRFREDVLLEKLKEKLEKIYKDIIKELGEDE